jgi:hypothetical protein
MSPFATGERGPCCTSSELVPRGKSIGSIVRIVITARELVQRLNTERPEWIPILRAAVTVAEGVERYGGQFAGSWVLQEWAREAKPELAWKPGLRTLSTYGLIEKVGDSTRGGRRAYYRMRDRAGVAQALRELGA